MRREQVRHQHSERSSACQAPVYTVVLNVQHIAACSMQHVLINRCIAICHCFFIFIIIIIYLFSLRNFRAENNWFCLSETELEGKYKLNQITPLLKFLHMAPARLFFMFQAFVLFNFLFNSYNWNNSICRLLMSSGKNVFFFFFCALYCLYSEKSVFKFSEVHFFSY